MSRRGFPRLVIALLDAMPVPGCAANSEPPLDASEAKPDGSSESSGSDAGETDAIASASDDGDEASTGTTDPGWNDGTGTETDTGPDAPPPLAHVDFEESKWLADTSCCKWLWDPRDDVDFRVPLEGARADLEAWISPTIAFRGERSFGARLESKDGCIEKQRVELEIASGSYFTQSLEMSRYYGFAVYVHPQSQDVVKPTIFFQAWQSHDVKHARYPPLSLVLEPGPDYVWSVYTSTGGSAPEDAPGNESHVYTAPMGLTKGVWHRFVVWFKPSITESGAIRVWLDGVEQVAQTHDRNFGYPPTSQSPGTINDWFEVRLGAYRGRLCTDPPTYTGRTILLFDEVKIGTSHDSVIP